MTTNHTVSLTLVDYIYICLYKKSRNLRGLWFLVELFVRVSPYLSTFRTRWSRISGQSLSNKNKISQSEIKHLSIYITS